MFSSRRFPRRISTFFFSGKNPRVTSAGRGDEGPSALPVALCAAGCVGTWRRQRHAWLNGRGFHWKTGVYPPDTRPGKHTKNHGKSPFLMGKSTISMAIFNSYVCLPEGISKYQDHVANIHPAYMFD